MNKKKTLLASSGLFAIALLVTLLIYGTEPEAKREAATKRTAMLVEVIPAEAGDFKPVISAMGTVKPAQEIILRARVSGQVIAQSKNFVPGGFVSEGEVLLQIDPADYQNLVAQRKSELAQTQTALQIEMGEQEIAKRDYQRLNQKLSDMQKTLVLREPQLNAAKARVEAAKAALAQAEVELERTKIKAPFDAQILSRNVNTGSQVSPNETLAQLIGKQTYWVEATVPLAKLRWLKANEQTSVQIRNRTAWDKNEYRSGTLHSIIGELEGQTRMARVLVEINDPLATSEENKGKEPLIVGSFVECQITAEALNNVVKLPREYLRKKDTAWVMQDETLSIRDLDIVFSDEEYAYVQSGLNQNEMIVTTALSSVRDGAELRLKE